MKKIATIAVVAAGTLGFAGSAFAMGCNYGHKTSMVRAEADMTPVPEKTEIVAETPVTDTKIVGEAESALAGTEADVPATE